MKSWTIERAAVTRDLMEVVSDFSGVGGQFKTSLVSVVSVQYVSSACYLTRGVDPKQNHVVWHNNFLSSYLNMKIFLCPFFLFC